MKEIKIDGNMITSVLCPICEGFLYTDGEWCWCDICENEIHIEDLMKVGDIE